MDARKLAAAGVGLALAAAVALPMPALAAPFPKNWLLVNTIDDHADTTDTVTNPCNGERVALQVHLDDVVKVYLHEGTDKSGTYHVVDAEEKGGGIGLTTKATYRFDDRFHSETVFLQWPKTEANQQEIKHTTKMIGQGRVPDFFLHMVFKQDADGRIRVDRTTTSCRG